MAKQQQTPNTQAQEKLQVVKLKLAEISRLIPGKSEVVLALRYEGGPSGIIEKLEMVRGQIDGVIEELKEDK
jgi:hypothetical protein